AARHVLAAMVAAAVDHRDRAGVADGEALARDAVEVGFAGDGAVEHGVAHDDVLGRVAVDVRGLADDDAAARKALADVVVGIADEIERDAVGEPGAEALPGDALEVDAQLLGLEAGMAVAAGDLTREHRTDGAVDVADLAFDHHGLAAVDRGTSGLDQL